MEPLKDTVIKTAEDLKGWAGDKWDSIKDSDFVKEAGALIDKGKKIVIKDGKFDTSELQDEAKETLDKIGNGITAFYEASKPVAKGAMDTIGEFFSNNKGGLLGILGAVLIGGFMGMGPLAMLLLAAVAFFAGGMLNENDKQNGLLSGIFADKKDPETEKTKEKVKELTDSISLEAKSVQVEKNGKDVAIGVSMSMQGIEPTNPDNIKALGKINGKDLEITGFTARQADGTYKTTTAKEPVKLEGVVRGNGTIDEAKLSEKLTEMYKKLPVPVVSAKELADYEKSLRETINKPNTPAGKTSPETPPAQEAAPNTKDSPSTATTPPAAPTAAPASGETTPPTPAPAPAATAPAAAAAPAPAAPAATAPAPAPAPEPAPATGTNPAAPTAAPATGGGTAQVPTKSTEELAKFPDMRILESTPTADPKKSAVTLEYTGLGANGKPITGILEGELTKGSDGGLLNKRDTYSITLTSGTAEYVGDPGSKTFDAIKKPIEMSGIYVLDYKIGNTRLSRGIQDALGKLDLPGEAQKTQVKIDKDGVAHMTLSKEDKNGDKLLFVVNGTVADGKISWENISRVEERKNVPEKKGFIVQQHNVDIAVLDSVNTRLEPGTILKNGTSVEARIPNAEIESLSNLVGNALGKGNQQTASLDPKMQDALAKVNDPNYKVDLDGAVPYRPQLNERGIT